MIARPARTFDATVTGGRLEHESLRQLEGVHVHVRVTVEPDIAESSADDSDRAALGVIESEVEPPEWLDVEKDIYVPMRGTVKVLKGVKIVDEGRARPTIILPEDLPND